ncbi:MAG: ribonuclease Y [Candidatus Pacebacteria bacterium]|nr:ribonuclease Y [Candidatus Paceibacterota bacterium]
MNSLLLLIVGVLALGIGSTLGYLARQSIARRNYRTIEARLQKKIDQARQDADLILSQAKEKSSLILESAKKNEDERRADLLQTERLLLRREDVLDEKISNLEKRENEFNDRVEKLKEIKENLEGLHKSALENLERISGLSREEAKKEFLGNLEREYQKEFMERTRKLESEGIEQFEKKAKEILALAIQKLAINQSQEITTTTVSLPSEEIKGRIIGKEGRNIRTLERLTGVEIVVDETPEAVVISAFDPIRRQIAKVALEKLMQDGRIQPARIEDTVIKAKEEIAKQIKDAGEQAVYDVGLLGLDQKLVQLLGRLRFRTSYGQNVLLHSIEVAHLAAGLAAEIGANAKTALKAGLLHDIGKAVDQQVEGSHTDIGVKILEKFAVEKEVVDAMKSHHEEYPYSSLEAIIVQTADAISGSRPGARKDTLENYLKRLGDLENIATSFAGVEKAWALQAGREIRVFVKPEEIDDFGAKKLAKEIANKIQEELKYPGEIKVNVIRESRVVEYAK